MIRLKATVLASVVGLAASTLACTDSDLMADAVGPQVLEEGPTVSAKANQLPASDPLESAMSAGPSSVSADATILDWNMNVLREGTNEWTCLPDRENTPGTDPWCVTHAWLTFLNAYVNQTEPTYTDIGFAYMLQGDTPVSNADPFETEATAPEDWVTHLGPHLMVLVPNHELLGSIPTDHLNGGPWVMWPDTPYAHIMIPLESRGPSVP